MKQNEVIKSACFVWIKRLYDQNDKLKQNKSDKTLDLLDKNAFRQMLKLSLSSHRSILTTYNISTETHTNIYNKYNREYLNSPFMFSWNNTFIELIDKMRNQDCSCKMIHFIQKVELIILKCLAQVSSLNPDPRDFIMFIQDGTLPFIVSNLTNHQKTLIQSLGTTNIQVDGLYQVYHFDTNKPNKEPKTCILGNLKIESCLFSNYFLLTSDTFDQCLISLNQYIITQNFDKNVFCSLLIVLKKLLCNWWEDIIPN
jgi:hypothetical protein